MVWRNQNYFLILFITLYLCTIHKPSNLTTLQDTLFPTPTFGLKSLFEVTTWVTKFFNRFKLYKENFGITWV